MESQILFSGNNKKLEMCPQYKDVPALGTSIKLCKGIAVWINMSKCTSYENPNLAN